MKISRRKFLKIAGLTITAIGTGLPIHFMIDNAWIEPETKFPTNGLLFKILNIETDTMFDTISVQCMEFFTKDINKPFREIVPKLDRHEKFKALSTRRELNFSYEKDFAPKLNIGDIISVEYTA